jgi:general secretion pathway protein H
LNKPAAALLRSRRQPQGFTLIEMLVVLVIIGVLVATTILSINTTGRDSQLEQERDRLATLIDYVRERGGLQTREYGLLCKPEGYEFVVYEPRTRAWAIDGLDSTLRARRLPSGLRLGLIVEGREVVLDEPQLGGQLTAADQLLQPQILLYSNGDLSSFELRIERVEPRRSVTIRNGDDGGISAGPVQSGTA